MAALAQACPDDTVDWRDDLLRDPEHVDGTEPIARADPAAGAGIRARLVDADGRRRCHRSLDGRGIVLRRRLRSLRARSDGDQPRGGRAIGLRPGAHARLARLFRRAVTFETGRRMAVSRVPRLGPRRAIAGPPGLARTVAARPTNTDSPRPLAYLDLAKTRVAELGHEGRQQVVGEAVDGRMVELALLDGA